MIFKFVAASSVMFAFLTAGANCSIGYGAGGYQGVGTAAYGGYPVYGYYGFQREQQFAPVEKSVRNYASNVTEVAASTMKAPSAGVYASDQLLAAGGFNGAADAALPFSGGNGNNAPFIGEVRDEPTWLHRDYDTHHYVGELDENNRRCGKGILIGDAWDGIYVGGFCANRKQGYGINIYIAKGRYMFSAYRWKMGFCVRVETITEDVLAALNQLATTHEHLNVLKHILKKLERPECRDQPTIPQVTKQTVSVAGEKETVFVTAEKPAVPAVAAPQVAVPAVQAPVSPVAAPAVAPAAPQIAAPVAAPPSPYLSIAMGSYITETTQQALRPRAGKQWIEIERAFASPRTFFFTTTFSGRAAIELLSTTENFHPHLGLFRFVQGESPDTDLYEVVAKETFGTITNFQSNTIYLLVVGAAAVDKHNLGNGLTAQTSGTFAVLVDVEQSVSFLKELRGVEFSGLDANRETHQYMYHFKLGQKDESHILFENNRYEFYQSVIGSNLTYKIGHVLYDFAPFFNTVQGTLTLYVSHGADNRSGQVTFGCRATQGATTISVVERPVKFYSMFGVEHPSICVFLDRFKNAKRIA